MTFSVQPFLCIPLKSNTTQDELTRMQGEILHVNIGIQTLGHKMPKVYVTCVALIVFQDKEDPKLYV